MLLAAGTIVAVALIANFRLGGETPPLHPASEPAPPPSVASEPTPPPAALSELADAPDWAELEPWQETIDRETFVREMDEVYTTSPHWKDRFQLGEKEVSIDTGDPDHPFVLRFAPPDADPTPPRPWRSAAELGPAAPGLPLEGLRVAIDPGHIGGKWATIEERWFRIGEANPVAEGDLTLQVARLLKPRLEALGATVTLVRDQPEPVTPLRPADLVDRLSPESGDDAAEAAAKLFYRTAEIRARADLVNGKLRPDLVICLHFNAEPWGTPDAPTLTEANHLHLLVNGAYHDNELALADQRFHLMRRILARCHDEETAASKAVVSAMVRATRLPPFHYSPESPVARNVDDNPYLWARNLLANRLYDAPVVYLEPFVMNSAEVHARLQAGDYEGLREVAGKNRPSIFREYADSVAEGLETYYQSARKAGR